MGFNTDVVIVGSGPTGLMLACQLQRFGINFRIIDKQIDRAKESRAFGIQAKSMEIFQNLGLAEEFLKHAQAGQKAEFYFNGQFKFAINFSDIDVQATPFPAIYFLPQSETEQILIDYLQARQITVERQFELITFTQDSDGVTAIVKNNRTGEDETIVCRYIVGCDGAHSTVRSLLEIPFVGASYLQNFILADVEVNWKLPIESFSVFLAKEGNLLCIPLKHNLRRIMITGMGGDSLDDKPPTLQEIEHFMNKVAATPVKLDNPVWITRFHLHHRAVYKCRLNRAFLAGDAAHIHTPVGAQGMNTGLQDASNLAWKIALVLKYHTPTTLLKSYQAERHPVGQVLVHTTDRIFGWITSKNSIITTFRQYLIPIVMRLVLKSKQVRRFMFNFISELSIHYEPNAFIVEKTERADKKFLKIKAGYRAPDAPTENSSLFELFRQKPFNILLFNVSDETENFSKVLALIAKYSQLIAVHQFTDSHKLEVLFDRYGISQTGIYFVRPDGYIGFRAFGNKLSLLLKYLKLYGFSV
ncbi:MAG TPA: FAD-dependent monooxygenase [Gammaproteobacteria bacterium]|nr:FAD-dependent monooxygenase [Gammaproteobacteria bacterium]